MPRSSRDEEFSALVIAPGNDHDTNIDSYAGKLVVMLQSRG